MKDRQDNTEVELMVNGVVANQVDTSPAKKRRLLKVADKGGADKGGASSSSVAPTEPFAKFTADMAAMKETKAIEASISALKCNAPKTKVPFYYDNTTFAVSVSRSFVKQQENENWKSFISFMKETAAPAVPIIEGSATHEVVEKGLGHPQSKEAQGVVVLAQDPRPDVVMVDPIPQLEFRQDVVKEKESKKSSLGKVSSKFKIKSKT